MRLVHLGVKRLVANRFLTAMMVAAFAFTGGTLVAGPVYAAGAEQAVVFAFVERSSPLKKDLLVSLLTPSGFDAARSTQDVRDALKPLPISRIVFQESSNPLRLAAAGGSTLAPVAYRDGVLSQVAVVQGRDPVTDGEVLLPESTAAALLVGPGARLQLSSSKNTSVVVTGIYSSGAGTDQLVFGQGRLLGPSATSTGSPLPLLATRAGFAAMETALGQNNGIHAEWDAEPDLRGATVSDLRRLADEASGTPSAIRAAVEGASVTADLGSLVPGAEQAVNDSLAPMYLVALEVAMVGLAVLLGIGSTRLDRQSFELAVLKTRGARTRVLFALGSIETLLAAALGFPLALAVGVGFALMARAAHGPGSPGAPFRIALNARAAILGAAGICIGAVALLLILLPHLRRSVMQERREASREPRPSWLRLPYEVLPLTAGTIALAELRRRGIGAPAGHLDPLVLIAPTLLILGGGILAVRALFWGLARAEPLADRIGSPSAYLALHRLPRVSANMSLALLLVLSMGLFGFSSSLRKTVLTGNQDFARGQVGADWNFLVATPSQGAQVAGLLPTGATMVFHGSVAKASDTSLAEATLIGLDPAGYPAGGWWRQRDADLPLSTLLARLKPQPIGLQLPKGTSSLQVQTSQQLPEGVHVIATLEGPSGRVDAPDLEPDGIDSYSASTSGAIRLLSLVVSMQGPPHPPLASGGLDVTFERLRLLGSFSPRTVPLAAWRGLDTSGQTVTTTALGTESLRARFEGAAAGPIGGIAPPDQPLPALVGASGRDAGLTSAEVRVGYLQLSLRVVGTLHAFLGIRSDTPIIVMPVRAVAERFAQINQVPNGGAFSVLAMGEGDPTSAVEHAGFHVLDVSRAATIEELLGSSPQNLALGMEFAAGVAGALLATISLGFALYLGARRRRYELSSLRALGGGPGHAATSLALEYGCLLVPSLLVGSVLGAVLLALVLPFVAPTGRGTPPSLLIDGGGALMTILVAAATLGAGLLITAGQMRAQPGSRVLQEEPE